MKTAMRHFQKGNSLPFKLNLAGTFIFCELAGEILGDDDVSETPGHPMNTGRPILSGPLPRLSASSANYRGLAQTNWKTE